MLGFIRNIIEGQSGKGSQSLAEQEQNRHAAAGVLLMEAANAAKQRWSISSHPQEQFSHV